MRDFKIFVHHIARTTRRPHLFSNIFALSSKYLFYANDWQTLPVKGQIINVLGSVGLRVSVITSQHYCYVKAAIDYKLMKVDFFPITLYLQK